MWKAKGHDNERIPSFLIRATVAACLGRLIFGYDTGIISTALPQLADDFNLNEKREEIIVSFVYVGCSIGSMGGGYLCDKFGRKKMILVTDAGFFIGAVALYLAKSFSALLVGRIITGLSVAIGRVAIIAYVHEMSPIQYRGSAVTSAEGFLNVGFTISYLVAYAISFNVPLDAWRYMFLVIALVATIQVFCMSLIPESPVWLHHKGFIDEANAANDEIHCEIEGDTYYDAESFPTTPENDNCQSSIRPSLSMSSRAMSEKMIEEDLASNGNFKDYYRQVIITILLSVTQSFCGHPNVLTFAPQIFAQIGFESEKETLVCTSLIGVVKFASVCFAMKKIEVYGRKYSILIGLKLIAFSLLVLSLAYSVHGEGKLILIEKIAATLALFGVFAGFSFSLSPIVALLVSDLFPSKIRGRALGTSALFSYLSGVLVSFTFLSAQEMFGLSAPFALYFIWTFMSIIFVLVAIPETAGKTPHEIHLELEQMWRMITWRKLGK